MSEIASTGKATTFQLGEAQLAYQLGNWAKAELLCREILLLDPQNEDAAVLGGIAAIRVGHLGDGERLLRDAIAANSNSVQAHHHLGNLLRQTGRAQQAEFEFREVLRVQPGDFAAYNELGLIYLAQRRWAEAESQFLQATVIRPDFAHAHYNLGLARQQILHNQEAIASFRQATLLAPHIPEPHSHLGNLLYELGRQKEAVESFRRAAALNPGSYQSEINRAKIHIHERDLARAEACLLRAIAREPKASDAWRLLGVAQKNLGKFDEAVRSLEKAIQLDAGNATAYHDLAYAQKIGSAQTSLIEKMESLLSETSTSQPNRATLHFALGKAFDDTGQYREAMTHFDEANRLESLHCEFDSGYHARTVDVRIARYRPGSFPNANGRANSSNLPVFIVGMMRSGTTLVEQILSSHPQVAAGGELPFWADAEAGLQSWPERADDDAIAAELGDAYIGFLAGLAPTAGRVTDKMPDNFLRLGLIHRALPNARIIHCRRNPIDTCLSIYFTRFGVAKDFAYRREDIVAYYRQYRRIVAHWRSVLPRNVLFEIDYEELIGNREDATRKLVEHCGLVWSDACLEPEKNRRPIATVSMWQARQPVYGSSVERWRSYEPWLGAFADLASEREHVSVSGKS